MSHNAKIVNYVLDPVGNLALDAEVYGSTFIIYPCDNELLEMIELEQDVYVDVKELDLNNIHNFESLLH